MTERDMAPKIDSRTRSMTPRDEELINVIQAQAASSGLFELSEVALGYVTHQQEGLKVSLSIRKPNGGIRIRSATLPSSVSTKESLKLIEEYLHAPSPMDRETPTLTNRSKQREIVA